jgi:tetratricopeptide (TPR) repeat protein
MLENDFKVERVNKVTCYRKCETTIKEKAIIHKPIKEKPSILPKQKSEQTIMKEIIALLAKKEWQLILDYLKNCGKKLGDEPLLLQFQAIALANLGKTTQAITLCQRSIELNPLDPHAYLLKALVLLDLNSDLKAEKALRQALFLNANFIEAQYRLGLLLIRHGNIDKGLNNLHVALQNAEKKDPNQHIHYMSQLTFAQFINILHNEILIYEQLNQ